jgi:nucleotide-binding universal stress UspA family protein
MNNPTILLPMRLGEEYEKLVRSGINLARTLNGKLSFLYILELPEYTGYTAGNVAAASASSIKKQKQELYDHYLEVMKEFKQDLSGELEVEYLSTESTWGGGIIKIVKTRKPDILLLQHEEKGLLEKILGETNTEIIHNVDCPVWIVPEQGPIKKPGKIAFVTNHTKGDLEVFKRLIDLNDNIKAELFLFHIIKKDDFDYLVKKEGFISLLDKETEHLPVKHLDLDKDDMRKDIATLIKDNDFDLLVVHNESEGFMNRFFTRSSVEKLTDSVEIPFAIY